MSRWGDPQTVAGFSRSAPNATLLRFVESARSHASRTSVLDVGCGIGTYIRRFRQYTHDVHGIEVEPERVAEASAELPNIVCAVGTVQMLSAIGVSEVMGLLVFG